MVLCKDNTIFLLLLKLKAKRGTNKILKHLEIHVNFYFFTILIYINYYYIIIDIIILKCTLILYISIFIFQYYDFLCTCIQLFIFI